MPTFRPKFISFDCYGTLTNFRMAQVAREIYAGRLTPAQMEAFVEAFRGYRLDEVLGAWKPYAEVCHNAVERSCKRIGTGFDPAEARRFYEAVPSWGPHPDVTAGLLPIADRIPLVILSNAMNSQIHENVRLLGAPFAHVLTAEDAQAYKPRYQAFEHMFDTLNAGPEDFLHVSSSFRYDLMTAYDLKMGVRVWVNRGHEPRVDAAYGYTEIPDIGGLAALVGIAAPATSAA
jgi:2-haloacid dehalogenase